MNNFSREAKMIKDQMGTFGLHLLENGGFVAGGAVTSAFSSSRINDIDTFFVDQDKLKSALATVPAEGKIETDAACSFIENKIRVQLIRVVTGTPEAVIRNFDFTVCGGAFDGKAFTFGEFFFPHLAQRRLVFNTASRFPICSLFRTRKFIQRGYSFSGIEAIKLGLTIQALKINTYGELREQMMGIDTLFLKELTDSLATKSDVAYSVTEFLETMEEWVERAMSQIDGGGE